MESLWLNLTASRMAAVYEEVRGGFGGPSAKWGATHPSACPDPNHPLETLIWAQSEVGVAASPPGMPWHVPEDFMSPPRADPSDNLWWFSGKGRVDQLAPLGPSSFPSEARAEMRVLLAIHSPYPFTLSIHPIHSSYPFILAIHLIHCPSRPAPPMLGAMLAYKVGEQQGKQYVPRF